MTKTCWFMGGGGGGGILTCLWQSDLLVCGFASDYQYNVTVHTSAGYAHVSSSSYGGLRFYFDDLLLIMCVYRSCRSIHFKYLPQTHSGINLILIAHYNLNLYRTANDSPTVGFIYGMVFNKFLNSIPTEVPLAKTKFVNELP